MEHNEMVQVEQARDVMISAIAQTMVIYGVSPSVGRIYGVLYFAEEALSLDEIMEQVAMSKASVSNGLRELLDTEMVIKVWKKGHRKDHYIAEKDFFKNFMTFFIKNLRQERNYILKAMEKVQPILENVAKQSGSREAVTMAKQDLKNIKESVAYFDWTMRLANAMENGEIYRYFPKRIVNINDQEGKDGLTKDGASAD